MQAWYFHDDGMENFIHTPPYINTPSFSYFHLVTTMFGSLGSCSKSIKFIETRFALLDEATL
jgi:hypothetical protein